MNKKSITINKIIPYDVNILDLKKKDSIVTVSRGYNYKKLCIIVFVIVFVLFLMISALLSIVGIVVMYHIENEPIPAQLITPTPLPTMMTNISTFNYSVYPTPLPTHVPSAYPSVLPTTVPSQLPTVAPSISPTVTPTNVPTSMSPSQAPSYFPSTSPSMLPTTVPSQAPSYFPSTSPSMLPTTVPSQAPSYFPSTSPSVSPSVSPSSTPSSSPITTSSMSPTNEPSYPPINQPNITYTAAPTPLLNKYTHDTIASIYNTTVFNSNQFSIIVELLSIICPICLCCVCIHIPLAFVPLCLANKKDKFNTTDKDSRYYKGSLKQTLDTIHHLIISSHTDKIKSKHKNNNKKIHPVKHT